MPDSIVSACVELDGVQVLWINRYAAGGNVFLDLEAVEDLTADPDRALDRLVELLPVVFRSDWGARVHRDRGVLRGHRGRARRAGLDRGQRAGPGRGTATRTSSSPVRSARTRCC